MVSLRFFFISFIFLLSFFISEAQVHKLERNANKYFIIEEFSSALPIYLQLDSLDPDNALYQYRTGVCLYNSQYKTKALEYFQHAQDLGFESPDLELYLARTYHLRHRFDEAIGHYQKFKEQKVEGDSNTVREFDEEKYESEDMKEFQYAKTHIDRYVQMCNIGKELVADSLFLVIDNIGKPINTMYPDYVPVVSADEKVLIFTSRRNTTTGGQRDIADGHYFEDVYISHKDTVTGKWNAPENMGSHVNSPHHDASIALSPDGEELFIYRSSNRRNSAGDIYVSRLKGTTWSVPLKMGNTINSPYWEPSASISSDEKTIFFTSDRPGGYGGTDIYMSRRIESDTIWSEPVNLGPSINTEFNEDAPYIHPDNVTLFFSSKGHRNMGGFDIFTTVYNAEKGSWSTPENAGYPINTADDDIYFIWSADGTKGFFSSWRQDSFGEKDIYTIHRPDNKKHVMFVKGKILDKKNNGGVGALIVVTDKITGDTIGTFNSSSSNGKYVLSLPIGGDYNLAIQREGYVDLNEEVKLPKRNPFFELRKDFHIDPIGIGTVLVFNNIFFDFDKAKLRPESNKDLEKIRAFLIRYPELSVEISGHTDDKGKDKYNLRLSRRRANAVVKYLVKNGISKRRLDAKGYGESKPFTSNETDEGRQLNRRTELKILDTTFAPVNQYKNVSITYRNQYETLDRTGSNKKVTEVKKTELPKGRKHITNYENMLSNKPQLSDTLRPKVHFLSHVSDRLTPYSADRVSEVIELMQKYPELKLKIVSYGDHTGDTTLHKQLSRKRAETVYKAMIHGGIDENRLQKESYVTIHVLENEATEITNMKKRRVEFIVIE